MVWPWNRSESHAETNINDTYGRKCMERLCSPAYTNVRTHNWKKTGFLMVTDE